MGVPKFYRWLSERYPLINQMLSTTAVLPEFDNFYLDMNGIIHACTHPNSDFLANSLSTREMMLSIFRYVDRMVSEIVKPKKLLFLAIDGVAPRAKLNQQRARRFCAAQGRTEAIEKARERGEAVDEDALFDSNCITPGTEFMETVSRHLKYFIRKKIKEDPLWRELTVVFSGHDVPGEGEHKIMQFIRDLRADPQYAPNVRHCMYGQDADLIMLGLATHEPHFALLREVINFNVGGPRRGARQVVLRQSQDAQFQLLHISLLREYLVLDLAHGGDEEKETEKETEESAGEKQREAHVEPDPERLIDDFIFLTFLVGNDFLPHLPTLDIGEHAFDVLISAHRQLYRESPGYIVHRGEIADLPRFEALCQLIGAQEHGILAQRESEAREFNTRRRKHCAEELPSEEELEQSEREREKAFEDALREAMGLPKREQGDEEDDEEEEEMEEKASVEAKGSENITSKEKKSNGKGEAKEKDYHGRYYFEKFGQIVGSPEGEEFLTRLTRHYLQGLAWCLAYYAKGCVSWTWYYPFHYGPMLQDMRSLDALQREISFSLGQPFTPFQQLLGCLPPASCRLLPVCYRSLMTHKDSPVVQYYPTSFRVDQDGKKNPWEAVVLLDFIPEDALLSAEREHCPAHKLTRSEIARNLFGRVQVYMFDPAATATFLSCNPEIGLPDIPRCQSSLEELPFSLAPGHCFAPELVPGTQQPIAGYPSLAMLTLEHVSLRATKLNVFGSASRYRSFVLQIPSSPVVLAAGQAELLLNRTVFVNYPHVHEARVVAVSTENEEVRLAGDLNALTDPQVSMSIVRTQWDAQAREAWRKESAAEREKFLAGRAVPGSGGLDIGEVSVRLRVRPLQGLRRDSVTGATRKVYAQSLEAEVPIQLAIWRPPVQDTRFAESQALPIELLMPVGATVVALSSRLAGCTGRVLGPHKAFDPVAHARSLRSNASAAAAKKRTVDVEFSVPQPEPPFGYALAAAIADEYISARDLCSLLRISPSVLGKVVGSVRAEPGRVDLGLNLKKNGEYQLLGYVRRVDASSTNNNTKNNTGNGNANNANKRGVWQGVDTVQIIGMTRDTSVSAAAADKAETSYWEYSTHAAALLCEYKARFPALFAQLESLPHQPVYDAKALLGPQATSVAQAIMDWMKAQPFFSLPRTPFTTQSLTREAMAAIERASDVHATLNATKGMQTVTVRNVPVEKLFCGVNRSQHDVALSHNQLEPRLGDRVVNLASVGVPLGLRGTVVTIHAATKYVEVIFDEEFISGKSLQGNCSQFRGKLCAWADLLLVSAEDALRTENDALGESATLSVGVTGVDAKEKEKDGSASKSKQLLSILKKKSPDSGAAPVPAPVTAASLPVPVAAAPTPARFAEEPVVETISASSVCVERYESPIVAAEVAAAAMRSALDRKRERLAAALQSVRDDAQAAVVLEARQIDSLVESASEMKIEPTTSSEQHKQAEAEKETAEKTVEEKSVEQEREREKERERESSAASQKVSGRSLLAAAAGLAESESEQKAALLLPAPENVLAHYPWMGVVSYDPHRLQQEQQKQQQQQQRLLQQKQWLQQYQQRQQQQQPQQHRNVVDHNKPVSSAPPTVPVPATAGDKKPCVHFAAGRCSWGDQCKYAHALSAPQKHKTGICNFHANGKCVKGDRCNYLHVDAKPKKAEQVQTATVPMVTTPNAPPMPVFEDEEEERDGEREQAQPVPVSEAVSESVSVPAETAPALSVGDVSGSRPSEPAKKKLTNLLANAKKAMKEKHEKAASSAPPAKKA